MDDASSRLYALVAARRSQWDLLLWQVPVLSFTAQAFLFNISLGGTSSRTARIVASLLSALMAYLSIALMARHRQEEIADARWLEKHEPDVYPDCERVHGKAWRMRRDEISRPDLFSAPSNPADNGPTDLAEKEPSNPTDKLHKTGSWLVQQVPLVPGFASWMIGLSLFFLASVVVLLIALVDPSLLKG